MRVRTGSDKYILATLPLFISFLISDIIKPDRIITEDGLLTLSSDIATGKGKSFNKLSMNFSR
ncbi:hypothetical protein JT323_gp10 [Proteus phage PM87]|uniref:Uncharacterized protein n=1 Tax=Proteus phage PM87 TaxID=2048007 RepID=A0A2H4PRA2_9CAUD|nr:hypothetical protein JT323_gp10 [Proteus phage PM87]ATW69836.1 hypothetical protein [Proteus phage PM87]